MRSTHVAPSASLWRTSLMSMSQRLLKSAFGWAAAVTLVGCAETDAAYDAESADEQPDVGVTSQALGSFTQFLPLRGSNLRVVESQFLGWGMLYSMQLRTGALVDAITSSFYTPSNPNNRYSPNDPVFARGPAGGTAGSPAPVLTCPAGFAATGMYGRSGSHVDMLGLICAQAGTDGQPVKSTEKPIGAYGGQGGTFFYDVCPAGQWLAGLTVEVATKSSGTNKIVGSVRGYCAASK